ncbi:MAG: ATP-binding protein [Planctomycetota bacterium]|jgi:CO dehydrogenase maturation factor
MKLAISGKGGVGKTTLAAALARSFASEGKDVYAIDADPDANLASALGVSDPESIIPLVSMKDLIDERTEHKGGGYGAFFKLNPHVSDIPEKFSRKVDGVHVLTLGTIYKGGSGCACPENVFLKTLISHLVLARDEVVLIDFEAGLEHLGRATARGMNALIVVVEPGRRAAGTAGVIRKLAGDIGIRNVFIVGCKVASDKHREFIEKTSNGLKVIGHIPYDEDILRSDLEGTVAYDVSPALREEATIIRKAIEAAVGVESDV